MSKAYKNLTKLQVETAEQVLREALRKRTKEIADKKEAEARKKHEAAMKAIITKVKKFTDEIMKDKKKIEKDPNFYLILGSNEYSDPIRDLDPTRGALTSEKLLNVRKKDGHHYNESVFTPDTTKEEEVIRNFILELKLGTAVMEDIKQIMKVIESIK